MSPVPVGGRRDGTRRQVAAISAVGIALVALGALGRLGGSGPPPSASPAQEATAAPVAATEPPDPSALLHTWQRPYAVTPDQAEFPSGRLTMSAGWLDLLTDLDGLATRSGILAVDPGRLLIGPEVLAGGGAAAAPCPSGEAALYDWSIVAQGTWLELSRLDPDPCPGRQARLAGPWVRESRVIPGVLPAGIYVSQLFAPFGRDSEGQLSIDVPAGWELIADSSASLALFSADGAEPPQRLALIQLLAQPRVVQVPAPDSSCAGVLPIAPGVGTGVDDIVVAITSRPGVVATEQAPIAIDGYAGRQIDLEVAPGWTGGCEGPDGHVVTIPLVGVDDPGGLGPGLSIYPDGPVRLILVELGSGRTMTIAVAIQGPGVAGSVEARVADLMPIVEGMELQPPAP